MKTILFSASIALGHRDRVDKPTPPSTSPVTPLLSPHPISCLRLGARQRQLRPRYTRWPRRVLVALGSALWRSTTGARLVRCHHSSDLLLPPRAVHCSQPPTDLPPRRESTRVRPCPTDGSNLVAGSIGSAQCEARRRPVVRHRRRGGWAQFGGSCGWNAWGDGRFLNVPVAKRYGVAYRVEYAGRTADCRRRLLKQDLPERISY
jgi:hypothetical protein